MKWSLVGLFSLCWMLWGAPSAVAGDPAVEGAWSAPISFPLVPVHSIVLPNGKVLFWPQHGDATIETYVWDPATNIFHAVFNGHTNLFCAGHALLADGRVQTTGGHHQLNDHGEPHTNFFDYHTNAWTPGPDMAGGRWYPTVLTLPNGDTLTASGGDLNGNLNTLPEVWNASTNVWRPLTGAQSELPYYPWLYPAPHGGVFYAGPDQQSQFLDPDGVGSWTPGPQSSQLFRGYGSAVMYEPGKILITGGGDVPTASSDVIDLNEAHPFWRPVGAMATRRRQHNVTVLPDGSVLSTGGTSGIGFNNPCGAQYAAELFNPQSEQWTTLAVGQNPRLYHSTAVLLPDGRVMVGGGTAIDGTAYPGCVVRVPDQPNVELFSPPYLFRGARPVITSAPYGVQYGNSFTVTSPDAAHISKISLIRLSSVTHSVNMNQRYMPLSFTRQGQTLTVTGPANAVEAPPGHYMLFLVNDVGVPSVASIVRIDGVAFGDLVASPHPIVVCDESGQGPTTLSWQTAQTAEVDVRRGSPGGALVAHGEAAGSVLVESAHAGDVFYLQNVSDGRALTAANTLATAVIETTRIGCSVGQGTITASPNPVPQCGANAHFARLSWTATDVTRVELRMGAPDGPMFTDSGPGSFDTWLFTVDAPLTVYLQDRTDGRPLSEEYTLARVPIGVTRFGCPGGGTGTITLQPNPVDICPTEPGTAMLSWTSAGTQEVEVRRGAADGPVVATSGTGTRSAAVDGITESTDYFLVDVSDGLPPTPPLILATVHQNVVTGNCTPIPASITATPNPVPQCGPLAKRATLSWNASAAAVQLRANSPSGPIFLTSGPGAYSTTLFALDMPTTFYLQDSSNGHPPTAEFTLATVSIGVTNESCSIAASGTLTSDPNPVRACPTTPGSTTLSWTSVGTSQVEVRQGAIDGPVVSTSGPGSHSAPVTGLTAATDFYLRDISTAIPKTLAVAPVAITTAGCVQRSGTIAATPNPVPLCGAGSATAKLTWSASGVTRAQLRAGAPDGPLFMESGPGTFTTSLYALSIPTTFFLQDVSDGRPLTAADTLASVTIGISTASCESGGTATGVMTVNPNPVRVCPGRPGVAVVTWTTSGASVVEVRGGAPNGGLFSATGPGTYSSSLYWVTEPLDLYLQNASNGLPPISANTVAVLHIPITTAGCQQNLAPALAPSPAQPSCASLGPDGLGCWLRTQLPPPACVSERTLRDLRPGVMRALRLQERFAVSTGKRRARLARLIQRSVERAIDRVHNDTRLPKSSSCETALSTARAHLPNLLGQ